MSEDRLKETALYAWVGEDDSDRRSDTIGIKIGMVPAGFIPLVAINREKMSKLTGDMAKMAELTGVKRYLVKYRFEEILTEVGE